MSQFSDAASEAYKSVPWRPINTIFPFSTLRGVGVHAAFAAQINAQGPPFSAEISYKNGLVVPYGTSGSVRADGVYGPVTAPMYVVELKSGAAIPTPWEIRAYYDNLPPGTTLCGIIEGLGKP